MELVDHFPLTEDIHVIVSRHVETVVQLSKGDINGHVSSEKKAVKSEASEIISGYRKGNKAPETTNVKIDFSLENLDLSELRGRSGIIE